MGCSHGGAIRKADDVVGSDWLFVDTWGLMANEVLRAASVGYAISGKRGN